MRRRVLPSLSFQALKIFGFPYFYSSRNEEMILGTFKREILKNEAPDPHENVVKVLRSYIRIYIVSKYGGNRLSGFNFTEEFEGVLLENHSTDVH